MLSNMQDSPCDEQSESRLQTPAKEHSVHRWLDERTEGSSCMPACFLGSAAMTSCKGVAQAQHDLYS